MRRSRDGNANNRNGKAPKRNLKSSPETNSQTPLPDQIEGFTSQANFDVHAALLSDPRLLHPMYSLQRAMVVKQMQRDYGNQYVQRLVDHVSQMRKVSGVGELQVQRQGLFSGVKAIKPTNFKEVLPGLAGMARPGYQGSNDPNAIKGYFKWLYSEGFRTIISFQQDGYEDLRSVWEGKQWMKERQKGKDNKDTTYHLISVSDFGSPTPQQLNEFVSTVDGAHKKVAAHCTAGLGRTGTFLAAYYLAKNNKDAQEAFIWVTENYNQDAMEFTQQGGAKRFQDLNAFAKGLGQKIKNLQPPFRKALEQT